MSRSNVPLGTRESIISQIMKRLQPNHQYQPSLLLRSMAVLIAHQKVKQLFVDLHPTLRQAVNRREIRQTINIIPGAALELPVVTLLCKLCKIRVTSRRTLSRAWASKMEHFPLIIAPRCIRNLCLPVDTSRCRQRNLKSQLRTQPLYHNSRLKGKKRRSREASTHQM